MTGGGAADGLTQIWLSPLHPAPGQIQHYRRLTFGSDGKPTNDVEYTYAAPASSNFAPSQDSCVMFSVPATRGQDPLGGPGGFAHSQATWVDYPLKQWWTASAVTSTAWFAGSAQVRACLAAGVWQIAGRAELDGQRAIRIVQPGGNETYWLSARTYLPMEMVALTPGGETITLRIRLPGSDDGQPGKSDADRPAWLCQGGWGPVVLQPAHVTRRGTPGQP